MTKSRLLIKIFSVVFRPHQIDFEAGKSVREAEYATRFPFNFRLLSEGDVAICHRASPV